jgi:hypothetical protein
MDRTPAASLCGRPLSTRSRDRTFPGSERAQEIAVANLDQPVSLAQALVNR